MSPIRLIKILASVCGVLVLVWLVYMYVQVPHPKAPYVKAISKADRITLQQGSSVVQLHRSSMASPWMVSGTNGPEFSTDDDRVQTLTSGLKDLQLEDVISNRADRAADYDVTTDSGMRVTLAASAHPLVDGIVGKQAPDFSHIYFRFMDSPSVYLGNGLIRGQLGGVNVNDWRRHDLISLPDAQIQRIQMESADGTLDLQRSSDSWTLDGQKIDPTPVYSLVGALAHLKADDFIAVTSTWTVDALSWASITVTASSQTITLHMGAEDPVTKRYPVVVTPPSFAWLSESKAQALQPKRKTFHPK